MIDGIHLGMILKNDLLQTVEVGQRVKGYIKDIRDDGKINLKLRPGGQHGRDELSVRILDFLNTEGGNSTLTDKSSPEAIYKHFGVSKANLQEGTGTPLQTTADRPGQGADPAALTKAEPPHTRHRARPTGARIPLSAPVR